VHRIDLTKIGGALISIAVLILARDELRRLDRSRA
jgi:hypothetical protein